MSSISEKISLRRARFDFALRMGDNGLILSHRLSQWLGRAHAIEEDIALANIALDLLGQARLWLSLAGRIEGRGRGEDALAFFRGESDFRHFALAEQPNGDFARTIMRQFLFDARQLALLEKLGESADKEFAALAAKGAKETSYHIRHSAAWMRRLGCGTAESNRRLKEAAEELLRFCGGMFCEERGEELLARRGVIPSADILRAQWQSTVEQVFAESDLPPPDAKAIDSRPSFCGHTEHLGYILAEMQSLPRLHPQAKW